MALLDREIGFGEKEHARRLAKLHLTADDILDLDAIAGGNLFRRDVAITRGARMPFIMKLIQATERVAP